MIMNNQHPPIITPTIREMPPIRPTVLFMPTSELSFDWLLLMLPLSLTMDRFRSSVSEDILMQIDGSTKFEFKLLQRFKTKRNCVTFTLTH